MTAAYQNSTRILVALDCIIFGFDGEALKLLLVKRNFEPYYALMGGFLHEKSTGEKDGNSITRKGQFYTLNGEKYQKYVDGYFTFLPELTELTFA